VTGDQWQFREVSLPKGARGALFLAAMPGRYRPLQRDLDEMREREVSLVACLNPRQEINHKSPGYHDLLHSAALLAETLEFPIPDFAAPERDQTFHDFVHEIAGRLRGGERVLLHCAGGIGRTGTVAGCILAALGLEAEAALAVVRKAGSYPENREQTETVHWFAGEVRAFPKRLLP